MNLAEHPTVRRFRERHRERTASAEPPQPVDAAWLRQLCLDWGAEDAELVETSRLVLDNQRDGILPAFPATRTLLSFVCRMNRESIRSPARSIVNLESHHTGDHVNEIARKVVATLTKPPQAGQSQCNAGDRARVARGVETVQIRKFGRDKVACFGGIDPGVLVNMCILLWSETLTQFCIMAFREEVTSTGRRKPICVTYIGPPHRRILVHAKVQAAAVPGEMCQNQQ